MPAFKPRFQQVAELIRRRILHGDYSINPIPSERQLAAEFEVNYMTVRRGLESLIKEKLLLRQPNGRLQVKRSHTGAARPIVGFLTPSYNSPEHAFWRNAVDRGARAVGCSVRGLSYAHWDDPLLMEVVKGFDGVFLIPETEDIPPKVVAKLKQPEHRVIVVGVDYSAWGLPSIELFPPICVQRLLDHFNSLGHRRIDCINTQPEDDDIKRRINQWRFWMAAHRYEGNLFDDPVPPYTNAGLHAYAFMTRLLASKKIEAQALFCTTAPVAMGVMRACVDRGIKLGYDLAVGTVNGEGIAPILNPTLTALEARDPTPYLNYCLDWMLGGQRVWEGPLLMQPGEVPLIVGESTVPKGILSI